MPEQKTIKCPFCETGEISILERQDVYSKQTIRVGNNRKTIPKLFEGKKDILVDCSSCHKSKKDIEKRLKEGKPPSKEEIIKRAQESGLPLRF